MEVQVGAGSVRPMIFEPRNLSSIGLRVLRIAFIRGNVIEDTTERREQACRWAAPLLLLLLMLLATGCTTRQLENNRLDAISDLSELRRQALSLVNEARRERGLEKLRENRQLDAAALAHAEDMARRGFYSHRSPERRDVADRYEAQGGGRWETIGENISTCIACRADSRQVQEFFAGWMRSPGHRENILNPAFEEFGFGIASTEGRVYAVQTFVKRRKETAGQPPCGLLYPGMVSCRE